MLTAFYSTKKKKKIQEWSLNLLFPSGNTSEDYLRILRNVPTKGAAAYMRGEWEPSGGRAEQTVHVIQTGLSGK